MCGSHARAKISATGSDALEARLFERFNTQGVRFNRLPLHGAAASKDQRSGVMIRLSRRRCIQRRGIVGDGVHAPARHSAALSTCGADGRLRRYCRPAAVGALGETRLQLRVHRRELFHAALQASRRGRRGNLGSLPAAENRPRLIEERRGPHAANRHCWRYSLWSEAGVRRVSVVWQSPRDVPQPAERERHAHSAIGRRLAANVHLEEGVHRRAGEDDVALFSPSAIRLRTRLVGHLIQRIFKAKKGPANDLFRLLQLAGSKIFAKAACVSRPVRPTRREHALVAHEDVAAASARVRSAVGLFKGRRNDGFSAGQTDAEAICHAARGV
eukprot:6175273-Pleurochrysis_carterae.AAC.2